MRVSDASAPRAFYFQRGEPRLFGFYHAPAGRFVREAAVVLCQPYGHEYIRCHRAFRLMAEDLSRSGFPVLRFDYSGCGDSAGDPAGGDLHQWARDIAAAMRECRARSNTAAIALVGLRLGAALAVLAAEGPVSPHSLVLWQPVRSGQDYVRELEAMHRELLRALPGGGPRSATDDSSTELIGFPYSRTLLDQLSALRLDAVSLTGVARIAIVEIADPDRPPSFRTGTVLDTQADHIATSGPAIWQEHANRALDGALVPKAPLSAIANWLAEVYS